MINSASLAETLDAINHAALFNRPIPPDQRRALADFITRRHDAPGTYARLFALFPAERTHGIRLFTGERVTNAAARHIAGEEACRALLLLKPEAPAPQKALADATADLLTRLGPPDATGPKPDDGQAHWLWPYRGGTYCCGPCSVSLWRHLTAGGLDNQTRRLARGLACLATCRKGDCTWRVFPYWYTLSALVEMDLPQALTELRYAAARCRPALGTNSTDPHAQRRQEIALRILEKIK